MSGSWGDKNLGTLGKAGVSIGSMANGMLTTYGVSGLAEKAGMSASTSSMLGAGAGMASSALAMSGPWGMAASSIFSIATATYNLWKEHKEKEKQQIRETAKEA